MTIPLYDINTARSYSTEQKLTLALQKLQLTTLNHLVVRNREGRWTAIFILRGNEIAMYATAIANCGFKVFG